MLVKMWTIHIWVVTGLGRIERVVAGCGSAKRPPYCTAAVWGQPASAGLRTPTPHRQRTAESQPVCFVFLKLYPDWSSLLTTKWHIFENINSHWIKIVFLEEPVFALEFYFLIHFWLGRSEFPNQGSNPGPLQWKLRVLTTALPGDSPCIGIIEFTNMLTVYQHMPEIYLNNFS